MALRIGINTLSIVPGEVGGGETYLKSLVQALAEVDTENEYFLFVTPLNRHLFSTDAKNFTCIACPVSNRSRIMRIAWEQAVLPLQARWFGLDVLHCPGNTAVVMRLGYKIVLTVHDTMKFWYAKHFPAYVASAKLAYWKRMLVWSASHADVVVVVSNFTGSELARITGLPRQRFVTVHSGAPVVASRGAVPPDASAILERYGVVSPYLLTVAKSSKQKNLERLVCAFMEAKRRYNLPHILVIAGGKGVGHNDLLRAIDDCSAEGSVILVGHVSEHALDRLYRSADAFVFASVYEGFGFPILEAMSYGIPVACSRAASLPEVGGDACVWFDPEDTQSMIAAIVTVLTDQLERTRIVQLGYLRVKELSWEKSARKMIEIFRQVAGGEFC